MDYFVTGATGFIGRHLLERLLARGGTVYALVRGMICEAIRARPKRVSTWLGVFGEVSYALVPRTVDLALGHRLSTVSRLGRGTRRAGPQRGGGGVGAADRLRPSHPRRALVRAARR
jgi:NAD(P)-dependent dehydrogenase (short-subunit alcohol dehydrogenase family)